MRSTIRFVEIVLGLPGIDCVLYIRTTKLLLVDSSAEPFSSSSSMPQDDRARPMI